MNRIIAQNKQVQNTESWILQLAQVITTQEELCLALDLDPTEIPPNADAARRSFSLRVPRAFVARMKKGDWHDPLLLQVLHSAKENEVTTGFFTDPLEEQNNAIPGLLHKYSNRALLITKTGCAINCRYCFRRHFPYDQNPGNKRNWQAAIDYIRLHSELNEIILSGGDPLMAKDSELDWLLSALEALPHIHRLRIHSRLAVVIPDRITDALCQRLSKSRFQVVLVTHINHPNEIDYSVIHVMAKLQQHGVTLLNQSVLLKGINDSSEILALLSDTLFSAGILPYYLHLLDRVQGAGHFLVNDDTAFALMRNLARRVSGYLVPRLCREIAGEKSKTILS